MSLMPEDVEKQLSPQEIADLFAFLCLDKPPMIARARFSPARGRLCRDKGRHPAGARCWCLLKDGRT